MKKQAVLRGNKGIKPGFRSGKLVVVQRVADDANRKTSQMLKTRVRVQCDCGNRLTVPIYYITRINPKQDCGKCRPVSLQTEFKLTYHSWYMMRVRCTDPKHINYASYGGRGITVCPQWLDKETGFEQFLKDMGPRPKKSLTLDRHPDNDGDYEPTNCRWATWKEQAANKFRDPNHPRNQKKAI